MSRREVTLNYNLQLDFSTAPSMSPKMKVTFLLPKKKGVYDLCRTIIAF